MIDVEYKVYTNVRKAVLDNFSTASVSGVYVDKPSKLPHVSIEETDSYTPVGYNSLSDPEFAAALTYTVNIFTNTKTAKEDAKAIAAVVNDAFAEMGFARSMKQEMPNIDRTIYRLILRFRGTAWKGFDGVDGHYNISAR